MTTHDNRLNIHVSRHTPRSALAAVVSLASTHTTRAVARSARFAAAALLLLSWALIPLAHAGTITPTTGVIAASGTVGTYAGDGPAISFTAPRGPSTNGSWSLGWQFTTNSAVNVTALGFFNATLYDSSLPGLSSNCGCGAVGIYDANGNLLTSATATASDPAIGDFNYVGVAPITLGAGGTYYIMALTGNADYAFQTLGFAADPAINFIQDAFFGDNTETSLTFPNNSVHLTASVGGGYFGPNFQISGDVTVTPEPPSWILVGFGVLVMALGASLRCHRAGLTLLRS